MTRNKRAKGRDRRAHESKPANPRDPWGVPRGTGLIPVGVDLTVPTGEAWEAELPGPPFAIKPARRGRREA